MVANESGGSGEHEYVAVDSAHAEHVLAFEIGSVAPPDHLHGDPVGAGPGHVGDVEFMVVVGALSVAYILAVDPDERRGVYAAEVYEYAFAVP